jgi:predicted regulator of Ras-like GTPase activity (Roadblock/LC7/MglB family)
MFGAIKKLFSKSVPPPPATAAPRPEPSVASAPVSHPAGPSPAPTLTGDAISLPLNEILSRLPESLTLLIFTRPGGTFSLPLDTVWEQLRTGAVRIPFGQLRQGCPPGTVADNPSNDDALIDLPLPLIVAAIGPAALARRPDQKRLDVPDEVTGVFAAKHGFSGRVVPAAAAPPAAPVAPAATPAPPPSAPRAPLTPVTFPSATPKPTTSIASRPAAPKSPASAPLPSLAPKAAPPLPSAAPRPAPPRPAPPSTAPAAAPAPSSDRVVTTIEALSKAWPEPVRHEIQQFNLGSATVSIPLNRLEAGMKAGRVVFTWADLCGWLNVPIPPPANGESQVELPLNVIAPLFLAKRRAAAPRKIVTVGEDVPNLFAGLGRPVAPPPAPAPPAAPVVSGSPPAPAAAPDVWDEIFQQPSQTEWSLKEITQRILALPGVAGALVASADGLLVAGQAPAPLKAETLAAFLPQIFSRLGGCVEEAQLGTLRALTLAAGPAPCAIFKAGALYLGVLGRPGQALDEAPLQRIAGELAKLNH